MIAMTAERDGTLTACRIIVIHARQAIATNLDSLRYRSSTTTCMAASSICSNASRRFGQYNTSIDEMYCELLSSRGRSTEMEFSLASHLVILCRMDVRRMQWSNGERAANYPHATKYYSLQPGSDYFAA